MYTGYAVIGFFRFFIFFFSCAIYLMSESIELGNRLSGSEILILTLQNSDDMLHSIFIVLISDSPNQTHFLFTSSLRKVGKKKEKMDFSAPLDDWNLFYLTKSISYILYYLDGWGINMTILHFSGVKYTN